MNIPTTPSPFRVVHINMFLRLTIWYWITDWGLIHGADWFSLCLSSHWLSVALYLGAGSFEISPSMLIWQLLSFFNFFRQSCCLAFMVISSLPYIKYTVTQQISSSSILKLWVFNFSRRNTSKNIVHKKKLVKRMFNVPFYALSSKLPFSLLCTLAST